METEQEIKELIERYRRLENIVNERMQQALQSDNGAMVLITHRIKTMESIRGKMRRKPYHYTSVYDLYDILGFRVICYFTFDVDKAAEKIAKQFRVDWAKSKDKRKLIDVSSFGYVSLHYVCALPEEDGDLSDLWFEVQIKTILQHSWAEIEHDLGYKSEIEIPREIRRSFSKAAGLLETTDDIFTDISRKLDAYKARVLENMENESLDDLFFDRFTITEFTAHNKDYRGLLNDIASITNAHITEGDPYTQLKLIDALGIRTLGDMTRLIREQHDLVMKLARRSLEGSELDELISTVAYYYLFRAKLISGDYSRERVREFLMLTTKNPSSVELHTERIMKDREEGAQ